MSIMNDFDPKADAKFFIDEGITSRASIKENVIDCIFEICDNMPTMKEVDDYVTLIMQEMKIVKKNYKVYTQVSWGAEKFYIDDENHEDIVFEARSEEHAIFQAAEYVRETSIYDADATEGWINMQNWYAEEV